MTINTIGSNGSLRIHTRASERRTSSNKTFQEQFRSGLGSGIDLANSALRQVAKPIPGSAALSASLSDAARNLSSSSKLSSSMNSSGVSSDSDPSSLQDEMVRNNQDLLEQQLQVSQATTSFTIRSQLIRAYFEASKTIGSNIR